LTEIVLVVAGPLGRADIPGLCDRLQALARDAQGGSVVCDVSGLGTPDVVAVDALARLQLTARRLGHEFRVRHACDKLRQLLDLVGLQEVLLSCDEPSALVEIGWEAEDWEQRLGVEEVVEPGDAAV
jgi:ABC-type transporter Mla MlaB component